LVWTSLCPSLSFLRLVVWESGQGNVASWCARRAEQDMNMMYKASIASREGLYLAILTISTLGLEYLKHVHNDMCLECLGFFFFSPISARSFFASPPFISPSDSCLRRHMIRLRIESVSSAYPSQVARSRSYPIHPRSTRDPGTRRTRAPPLACH